MHQQNTLKISEIFFSAQGEGLRVGEPTIFVRFAGCEVRCDFCDTKYAWNEGEEEEIKTILKKIEKFKSLTKWVCITGGEPMLQDISELVKMLKKQGYLLHLETNGRIFRQLPFDWVTISPKPPNYIFAKEYVNLAKEVKLVVDKYLSMEIIKKISWKFRKVPVFLQPDSMKRGSMKKAYYLWKKGMESKIKNLKLGYQIQKIYRIK